MVKAKTQAEWIKMKPADMEKMVVELAKQGVPAEKIGIILRDQHGIPSVKEFGKKMGKILKENGLENDSEKKNFIKKMDNLKKHIEKNKLDHGAKRSLATRLSRMRRFNN